MPIINSNTNVIPSFKKGISFIPGPELQAILQRGLDAGFVMPGINTQRIMQDLINDLIDNNLWNSFDVLFNFAYNETLLFNFSRINWVNPNSDLCTIFGGMQYTVNGWEGNGIDGFIDSQFNPTLDSINYTLNNAQKSTYLYKQGVGNTAQFIINGIASANNAEIWYNLNLVSQRINQGANVLNASVDLTGTGYKAIARISPNDVILVNGASEYSRTASSMALVNENFLLFRRGSFECSNVGMSMNAFSSSFNFAKNQVFRTIYNTFLSNLALI